MTRATPASERQEQAKWRARKPLFSEQADKLLLEEFESLEQLTARQLVATRDILTWATQRVPYYRERTTWAAFETRAASSQELLGPLPVLKKADVQAHFDTLKAEGVPEERRGNLIMQSSGTTGRPTRVLFNARHHGASFALHAQRHMRWERVNPRFKTAVIRRPGELGRGKSGGELEPGEILREPHWAYIGLVFETGPSLSLSRSTPLAQQVAILAEERPDCLVTYPSALESMVLFAGGKPAPSLVSLRTISATLTSGMRRRIEEATELPILQNYGLNELGLVASRCPSGRYHTNPGSFLVEILNDQGMPCLPGEIGHVIITGLTNLAMPLVRYDSGDLAEVVEGPCPCGRSLPSFGRIVGRYRAMHHAPAGTGERVNRLMGAIDELSLHHLRSVQEYQLHQYRDGSFELRVATPDEVDAQFTEAIFSAWHRPQEDQPSLVVKRVDKIPVPPGGKQQEFSSDFFPSIDEDISP